MHQSILLPCIYELIEATHIERKITVCGGFKVSISHFLFLIQILIRGRRRPAMTWWTNKEKDLRIAQLLELTTQDRRTNEETQHNGTREGK